MSKDSLIAQAIKEQYDAAFKMVEEIIVECEEDLWQDSTSETVISQVVYHTMYAVDQYLSRTTTERDSFQGKYGHDSGSFHDPKRIYSKDQLLIYLQEIQAKADKMFKNITIDELNEKPTFEWHGISLLSSLLYDLRHIMLHVGALHVRVNQKGKMPLRWVSKIPEDERDILNEKGVFFIQNGNLDEAEKIYVQLCAESENPTHFYNLACTYSRLGKLDQSIGALKKCLDLKDPERYKNLAKTDSDFENLRELEEFNQLINN